MKAKSTESLREGFGKGLSSIGKLDIRLRSCRPLDLGYECKRIFRHNHLQQRSDLDNQLLLDASDTPFQHRCGAEDVEQYEDDVPPGWSWKNIQLEIVRDGQRKIRLVQRLL